MKNLNDVSVPSSLSGRDAARARADILAVATIEFADKGLSGARTDEIARQTKTSKRMIYYYFGSKEGLYRCVLEQAYSGIRTTESVAGIDAMPPAVALARLVELTFNYHNDHPEFVRLVMNENILRGANIGELDSAKTRNDSVVAMLAKLLDRGVADGVFRTGLDPLQLHMSISALAFYNVSNRYTFSRIFQTDIGSQDAVTERRAVVVETILRWCRA